MNKLNNKGFAISTLLYGIMIMIFLIVFALMSILGTTRKNTKNLVSQIEEELNMYSNTNVTMMYDSSITEARTYIAPSSGWYRIELWGSKLNSSPGSYVSGMIYLKENNYLYINLGKEESGETDSYIELSSNEESTIMLAPGAVSSGEQSHYKIIGYAGTEIQTSDGINTIKTFNIEYGEYNNDGTPKTTSITPKFYDGMVVKNVNNNVSKVKISKISDNESNNPPGRETNTMLKNIKYIKDCITGSSNVDYPNHAHWVDIQAIRNGFNQFLGNNNVASVTATKDDISQSITNSGYIINGKVSNSDEYSGISGDGNKCITVQFNTEQNLDEIAVWHYYKDKRSYYNHTLSVSADANNWTELRRTMYSMCGSTTCSSNSEESESSIGIRYSTFQPYPGQEGGLPEGKYYIFYIGDDDKNKVITQNGSSISTDLFAADTNQQWQVSKNADGTYRITNVNSNYSIEKSGNIAICNKKDYNVNQRWIISGTTAGFYSINDPTRTDPNYAITSSMQINAPRYSSTQRFKFVKIN